MRFDYTEYVIPVHYISAIEYNDMTGLNFLEIGLIKHFFSKLPEACTFTYDEEEYFSHTNDIDNFGSTVVDAKCHYEVKESS